jgi:1-phosphofructokinase family hexose kinase
MIVIITPNPALDRTMVIHHLRLGQRHRAQHVLVAAGGKGLNVARAAQTLKQPFIISAPLGGLTGQLVAHLSKEEGFECRWSWHSAGETRTCILLVDPDMNDATPLDEHGPSLSSNDWLAFVDTILDIARHTSFAAICGSLPPSVPAENLTELIHTLKDRRIRTIVDTSKQALTAAIEAQPYGIKGNNDELSTNLALPITTVAEAVQAGKALRAQGIELAVITMGAEGAIATNSHGTCIVRPPLLKIVSTVGSGDSLLAGLMTRLEQGAPLDIALQHGVACGSADALTIGGGLIHMHDVDRIQATTTIEWVS